jgi:competence ComEA-like helix-hairpin-helix protein
MSDPQLPQSPPGYSPLARTPTQWTLALIASVWIFSMCLAGGMSRPDPSGPGIAESTTLLRIDVNTADARELSLLPRVGPVLARRIVSNRERLGQFGSVEDLIRVHGLGPKTISGLGDVCEVSR